MTMSTVYVGFSFLTADRLNIDKAFPTRKSAFLHYASIGYSFSKKRDEFYKKECAVKYKIQRVEIADLI